MIRAPRRLLRAFLPLTFLLLLTGCDDFFIANSIPSDVDEVTQQIIGTWLDSDGKMAFMIKRGPDQSYLSWTADDLKKNAEPTVFYVSLVGGMYFEEHHSSCSSDFGAIGTEIAPSGCWSIQRLIINQNSLQYVAFDTMNFVRKSVAGEYAVVHRYSVRSDEKNTQSADVLIEGSSDKIERFLANFARGRVYRDPVTFHRAR